MTPQIRIEGATMAHNSRIYIRTDDDSKWVDISAMCTGYHVDATVGDATKINLSMYLLEKAGDHNAVIEGELRQVLAKDFVELKPWMRKLRKFVYSHGWALRTVDRIFRAKEVTTVGASYRKYLDR